jgi:hypothetical protein
VFELRYITEAVIIAAARIKATLLLKNVLAEENDSLLNLKNLLGNLISALKIATNISETIRPRFDI